MATTTPTYWGWLVIQDQSLLTNEDVRAYDLPDYNGPRTGLGMYVDLYVDPAREQPLGRLWAADANRAGLLHVQGEDDLAYAQAALELRRLKADGVDSLDAFQEVAGDYTAGAVFEGDLDNIADPDIEANATI